MNGCFACVSVHHVYAVPLETRRWRYILQNWSYGPLLRALMTWGFLS